jgi:TonB family protein
MKKHIAFVSPALLILTIVAQTTYANEPVNEGSKLLFEVKNAEVIERVHPNFPIKAARRMQEGWVRFTYVITEEGKVIDPVVTDSSGERSFEKEALRAIKKWKFKPATQDGKPIQQCEQSVQFDFKLDELENGVRPRFASLYKKANQAMVDNDLASANELLTTMKNKKIWNLYENAWFWMLKSRLSGLEGNADEELSNLYRANSGTSSKRFLGERNYTYNLERIFILELQSQKFIAAYDTFIKLQEQDNASENIARLQKYFDRLDSLLNSDEPLIQDAQINDRGIKKHKLYKNSFAVADIEGELDMLDIRCDHKRTKFTVATDTFWSIPETWGKCSVLFEGDEDTTFRIIEVDELAKSVAS